MIPAGIAPLRRVKQYFDILHRRVGVPDLPIVVIDYPDVGSVTIKFQQDCTDQKRDTGARQCQPWVNRGEEKNAGEKKKQREQRNPPLERRGMNEQRLL